MKINDMCGEKNTGKKNKVKETVAWNDEVLRWCLNAAKDSGMKFYDLSDVTDYKIVQGISGSVPAKLTSGVLVNQSKYSQNFLSVIISDFDVILLSNIIHNIYMIFSVI